MLVNGRISQKAQPAVLDIQDRIDPIGFLRAIGKDLDPANGKRLLKADAI